MNFMNAPQSAGVLALIRLHKQQYVTTVNWVAAVYFSRCAAFDGAVAQTQADPARVTQCLHHSDHAK